MCPAHASGGRSICAPHLGTRTFTGVSLDRVRRTPAGAHVWPTQKVMLTESPKHLQRTFNAEAGLPLIELPG